MTKKVLLVGHTGTIGKDIYAELQAKKYEVTTVSRKSGFDANDSASVAKAVEGIYYSYPI